MEPQPPQGAVLGAFATRGKTMYRLTETNPFHAYAQGHLRDTRKAYWTELRQVVIDHYAARPVYLEETIVGASRVDGRSVPRLLRAGSVVRVERNDRPVCWLYVEGARGE